MTVAHWRERKIGDLLRIKHGFAFLGEHFANEGTHVVLTPGNFLEEGGFKEQPDKAKWYTGRVPPEYVLSAGDVIVAMTEQAEGLLGSSAIVPKSEKYLHNQRLGLVQVLDRMQTELRFVYYLFNSASVRQQIRGSASGTKIRHTSPTRIGDVRVAVPPLSEQLRIAGILASYDDLLMNGQRRVEILEAMLRGVYQEWFVHFRFPGHAGCSFEKTALGITPRGWLPTSVGDISVIRRGRSYRSADLAESGGLPFLNLKCINRDGGFRRSGLKRYVGEYAPHHTARRGDIVVAVTDMTQERRIVGRAGLVPSLGAEFGVVSMDLVRVEPRPGVSAAFLYSFLRFSGFADEVKQHANGANVLHLSPERITAFVFARPPSALIERFAALVSPILEQCDTLQNQIVTLRRTRDLLLPRLLSGQLDVSTLPEALE